MSQERLVPTDRTALVTHKGCLDGTGAALMFCWAGGRRQNVLFKPPMTCGLTPEEADSYDEVWFADLCPIPMENCAGGKPYRVFDHHASNERKFGANPLCTFDMTRSGTSLMAHVLGLMDGSPDVYLERLVQALEAYDLGRFNDPKGIMLADLASSFSQDQMLDLMYHRKPYEILYDEGLEAQAGALAAGRMLYAKEAARTAQYFNFGLPGGGTVTAGMAVSPVFWKNEVAIQIMQRADLAIVLDVTGGMVSLRSHTVDCTKIAEAYGGGGHARAAGFKMDRDAVFTSAFLEIFE